MYKSGQIHDNYGGGFREFDDRPRKKVDWGLTVFWYKDNRFSIDSLTLKSMVTPYPDTNDQKFF